MNVIVDGKLIHHNFCFSGDLSKYDFALNIIRFCEARLGNFDKIIFCEDNEKFELNYANYVRMYNDAKKICSMFSRKEENKFNIAKYFKLIKD